MAPQQIQDKAIRAGFKATASISILVVALIFFYLFQGGLPFFAERSPSDLLAERWIPVSFQKEQYGLLPLLVGSLSVTFWGTLLAVPVGLIAAVYIAELATKREREILKPVVELLAGIPSVVLGFFGAVVIVPLVKDIFNLSSGLTALSGAILLALMAIPAIVSISEDAIRSVPQSFRDASLALGASNIETVWLVVVPAALSGIIAAIMLGVGRVIGETMAVLMGTGNAALISWSAFESVRTMTATIAAEMGEVAIGSTHYHALFVVGVILLLITFGLNMIAQHALRKYRRY